MAWVIGAAVIIAATLAVMAYLWPITVSISLASKLTPKGHFAVVAGASVGPMSFALATARGVPPRVVVQGMGRVWVNDTVTNLIPKHEGPEVPLATRLQQLETWWARLNRFFDPLDLAFFLLHERRVVRVGWLDARVRYGLDDPAAMGLLTGWLFVLDGFFGGRITIRPDPIWYGDPEIALDVDGVLRVYPVRSAVALVWFLLKYVRVFPRVRPAIPKEAT